MLRHLHTSPALRALELLIATILFCYIIEIFFEFFTFFRGLIWDICFS
jgi:hypothetical protein